MDPVSGLKEVEKSDKPEVKVIPEAVAEVAVRAEQIPFKDLMIAFIKSGFKPDEMDKQFERKEGTCRTRLRNEFATKLPDKVETKDGKEVIIPGGVREEGIKLRQGISAKVKVALGPDKELECLAAIDELYKDLRVGGSGRKIDKEAIIASLEFDLS